MRGDDTPYCFFLEGLETRDVDFGLVVLGVLGMLIEWRRNERNEGIE